MTPSWAQRREEILSDCLVSPDVFKQMVERLGEFVVRDFLRTRRKSRR